MNELTVVTGSALIEALHNGTPIAVPKRREIFLKTVYISGWNYRENIYDIAEKLSDGERLTLQREPTNEHDEHAIKILDKDGNMLGYVPQQNNSVIAHLMDIGNSYLFYDNGLSYAQYATRSITEIQKRIGYLNYNRYVTAVYGNSAHGFTFSNTLRLQTKCIPCNNTDNSRNAYDRNGVDSFERKHSSEGEYAE